MITEHRNSNKINILMFELMCYNRENINSLEDLTGKISNRKDIRLREYLGLLKRSKRYGSLLELKSKNMKLYNLLVENRVVGRIMLDCKWTLERFQVEDSKEFVLAMYSKSKKEIHDIKVGTSQNAHKRIANFIYNHSNFKGLCFDPNFANKMHAIFKEGLK